MKSGGYVYILANKKWGTLYVGSTSDLVGRIWQHKHKIIPGFTAKYGVDQLVYYEWHDSLRHMVVRERQIKEWKRDWKIRLIMEMNPTWNDLYPDILIGAGYNPDML
ncbi:GIY-YIG nuclease family protein [bacterium]|nr:GIY-YIG nuclease family protein [bacterium]